MIITKNWINEFIDISDISTENIANTLSSIGLEVASIKKSNIPKNIVIGRIIEKQSHPNANKLSICKVDVGTEVLQIVCGASNVKKNQYVPVALIGCNINDKLKIQKTQLRGIDSFGMICSSKEINLPKIDDGILELDDSIGELILGKNLKDYQLLNDDIIEIELTANRGDCLSIYGICRDLKAYYKKDFIECNTKINSNEKDINKYFNININNKIKSSLIYSCVDLTNFKLATLQKIRLAYINKYTKNKIQNIIEYNTHTTGVLFNIYPQNNINKKNNLYTINIENNEEEFDEIKYNENDSNYIGIYSNNIKENLDTKIYLIEANYINPITISKNKFKTKKSISKDSVEYEDMFYRSSRGSEPDIKEGLAYIKYLIYKNKGIVYSNNISFIKKPTENILTLNIDKICSIIGNSIPQYKIILILEDLGFKIDIIKNNEIKVKIPEFRHDIENIADIAEEIIRIIGINNIKSTKHKIEQKNEINKIVHKLNHQNELKYKAISHGFYETITYIFTSRQNLDKYQFDVVKEEKDLLNPINKDLNTYRTTILLNLVEAVSKNSKNGFKDISFFEIGTVFDKNRVESKKISFIQSGNKEDISFLNNAKPKEINFFEFSKKLIDIIGKFDIEPIQKIDNKFIHPYQNGNIIINNKKIGYISKLHPEVSKEFNISDNTFISEIDITLIDRNLRKATYYSKFQSSKRDLTILKPKNIKYVDIRNTIDNIEDNLIKSFKLIDIYSNEKDLNESITIRFNLQKDRQTMQDIEIENSIQNVLKELNDKLNIGLKT